MLAKRLDPMSRLLGCIADDFTGATDLASMLVRHGMRTVQLIGLPEQSVDVGDAQAIVIALKSRNIPAHDAIEKALRAQAWLQKQGTRQTLFKYCSTFDSTDAGNIGQVSEALLDALGSDFTIACPAFPENGRTVYQGHLFVGEQLLSNSSMRYHPITPMADSNLVAVLKRQSQGKIGLIPFSTVDQGPDAIREAIQALRASGVRQAVVDAITDRHLISLGHAAEDLRLITGGSGIAMGLPDNFRDSGLLGQSTMAAQLPKVSGYSAVLAGSCSTATLGQIEKFRSSGLPTHRIDVRALCRGRDEVDRALSWAQSKLGVQPILISASESPMEVAEIQRSFGRDKVGTMVEETMAAIGQGLRERKVRRFVLAGGETSGAVVNALGVKGLRIGPSIDPGVPWTTSLDEEPLALALKSGNFGAQDFFTKAFAKLDEA